MALMTARASASGTRRRPRCGLVDHAYLAAWPRPVSLMQIINEIGRHTMGAAPRRSAIWAGLPWNHPDVDAFIRIGTTRRGCARRPTTPRPRLSTRRTSASRSTTSSSRRTRRSPPEHGAPCAYPKVVDRMLTTAGPASRSTAAPRAGEVLRNACTEVTSADDSDVCNLGGLVLSRFDDPRLRAAVADAVLFLTAGTLYSGPAVRGRRRDSPEPPTRPGRHGRPRVLPPARRALRLAGVDGRDASVRRTYERTRFATLTAGRTGLRPQPLRRRHRHRADRHHRDRRRTTTDIGRSSPPPTSAPVIDASPDGDDAARGYVVDPTARRLVESGVDRSDRGRVQPQLRLRASLRRQHFWQRYTDHGISSTVNLPRVVRDEDEQHEFGDILMRYLPELRGITCYPDGAPRPASGGRAHRVALASDGYVVEEDEEKCVGGSAGSDRLRRSGCNRNCRDGRLRAAVVVQAVRFGVWLPSRGSINTKRRIRSLGRRSVGRINNPASLTPALGSNNDLVLTTVDKSALADQTRFPHRRLGNNAALRRRVRHSDRRVADGRAHRHEQRPGLHGQGHVARRQQHQRPLRGPGRPTARRCWSRSTARPSRSTSPRTAAARSRPRRRRWPRPSPLTRSANALVSVANAGGNDGTGVVTALSATNLSERPSPGATSPSTRPQRLRRRHLDVRAGQAAIEAKPRRPPS